MKAFRARLVHPAQMGHSLNTVKFGSFPATVSVRSISSVILEHVYLSQYIPERRESKDESRQFTCLRVDGQTFYIWEGPSFEAISTFMENQ